MKQRLLENFPDGTVEVEDLTGTSNHFRVQVESGKFAGLSLLDRQKSVMAVFNNEVKSGEVHALSIKTIIKE